MQMVLNLISILAFGISLYNLFYQILKSRLNLKIEINSAMYHTVNPYWYYLDLDIINKSIHPISIYCIKILIDNNLVSVQKKKSVLSSKNITLNENASTKEYTYSQELPFEIHGYLVKSGKFVLDLSEIQTKLSEGDEYSLLIYTSRGKTKKKIKIAPIICDVR